MRVYLVFMILVFSMVIQGQKAHASITDTAFSWILKSGMLFSEETIFTLSYSEGYNLNFEVSEEEVRSVLPANLAPINLKILENDSTPRFYISLYLAGLESNQSLKRVDVFTYAVDQNNDKTLYFLSSVMELPERFQKTGISQNLFKKALNFLARDSRTGKPSYPHFYTETIESTRDRFVIAYNDTRIESQLCPPVSTDNRFSRDFVLVNSQIYRNEVDKNVNYFNQSFIDANVETRDLDCVSVNNVAALHPLLDDSRLKSIQFYGSKDKQVKWYFEM